MCANIRSASVQGNAHKHCETVSSTVVRGYKNELWYCGASLLEFESQFHHLLAELLWASYLTSLCFS